jgi:hypothetical protein
VLAALEQLEFFPTLQGPRATLAHYLELLGLLIKETADRLVYDCPTAGQKKMIQWLKTTLAQDP